MSYYSPFAEKRDDGHRNYLVFFWEQTNKYTTVHLIIRVSEDWLRHEFLEFLKNIFRE